MAAAGGDVAMVVDPRRGDPRPRREQRRLTRDGARAWLDQPWLDTVTIESRPKVDALLRDAAKGDSPRWREINQITAANRST